MKNETNIKVPKKYAGKLDEIYLDCDGYWAHTKKGYMVAGMGSHTAHESTQQELLGMIRTIKKCDCEECSN